ncbi:MAG: acylneuraminate cytidylyltransferase family protein [Alphaproteobacteria bacterium]|nr:acylneuraminate cytidylyltransferase family protein [Alphaproteobacteria bacterium]
MITVFLPCRYGSQRVKNKNTKPFCMDTQESLLEIKLKQLIKLDMVDIILLSTNDDYVKEIANKIDNKKIVLDDRPDSLGNSKTKTDDLIQYVEHIIPEGDVLWTHVTSPFVNEKIYADAIIKYKENLTKNHQSLMSVIEIKNYLWQNGLPINYDYQNEKWPQTQTLNSVFEVNNAIFMTNIDIYKNEKNRICQNPFLFKMSNFNSLDIDWEDDFDRAQKLWKISKP